MNEQIIYTDGSVVADRPEAVGALQQAADMLLKMVRNRLESTEIPELTPQAAKHFSSTLKDIRDLQNEAAQLPKIIVELAPELENLGN